MAKTFRFTDEEEQALNEVALKLNRDLVKAGKIHSSEARPYMIAPTSLPNN